MTTVLWMFLLFLCLGSFLLGFSLSRMHGKTLWQAAKATSLFQHSLDAVFILDPAGRLVESNRAGIRLAGAEHIDMRGHSIRPLVAPEDWERVSTCFHRVLAGTPEEIECGFNRLDGSVLNVIISSVPLIVHGKVTGVLGIVKDVTHRNQMMRELSQAKQQLRNIFDSVDLAILSIDLMGTVLEVSRGAEAIYGLNLSEITRDRLISVVYPEDLTHLQYIQEMIRKGQLVSQDLRIVRPDGTIRWIHHRLVPVRDADGKFARVDGIVTDIQERKVAEEQVRYIAQHDVLTGLPNRLLMMDRLQEALAYAKRNMQKAALLFVDLNNFKHINDTFGHAVGDLVLVKTADRIRSLLRESDTCARVGGDEFVVILRDAIEPSDVQIVLDKIRNAFQEPIIVEDMEVLVSFSIGTAMYPDDATAMEDLLRLSDGAMYEEKRLMV